MSDCREMELLMQADIDGELRPAEVAVVVAHRQQCAECERVYQRLLNLRSAVREDLMYHAAPAKLREALLQKLAQQTPTPDASSSIARALKTPLHGWRSWPAFGAGAALAASLVMMAVPPAAPQLVDSVVAGHIRALQPGHLLDVVSTDQHNVKPWFDGKIDFAPPVKNLASSGFPLQGGRLDYLNGRSVAALVYVRGKHPINLFVCPDAERKGAGIATGFHTVDGYNVYHWRQDDLMFWVVSDLNRGELSEFVDTWKTMTF